jgi:uncharacterized protein YbaP (TraB family)
VFGIRLSVMRCHVLRAPATLAVALLVIALTGHQPRAQGPQPTRGFIWTVEQAGRIGWLVGSMHMLTPDSYPLPATMTTAFEAAETLMVEADVEEIASPAFAAAVMARALYTDGRTVEDQVSPDTFRLISERAAAVGLPLDLLRRMKPWMIATTLQALELRRGGFDPALGLDLHFYQRAKQAGKQVTALETGLEQISYLENLGPELEESLIRENLQSADIQVKEVGRMAGAWAAGDAPAVEQMVLGSLKDAPSIYRSLIVERNRNWLPRLRRCLDTTKCFVVVGAGHLVGPDGLIAALRAARYTVTQQ